MAEVLEEFFSSRLPIMGLAAYSFELQGRVLGTRCLTKSIYPSSAEQMLSTVMQGCRTLLPAGQNAARYCWVFECLRIYVAARSDGASLGLLVENNPGAQINLIHDSLQAFIDLPEV